MKCSIVIPTYNHCEDLLKPCLESVIKFTDLTDTEVIVSANGCTDNTRQYVESLGEHFKLVWSDKPTGFTIGTNDGIKVATGEFIILLSNDTILLEQQKNSWIDMLVEPLIKDPKVGITGPMHLEWDQSGRDFLIFFCVGMRKSLFDEIGLLDEIFNPGFGEDVDLSFKAQDAGYSTIQVPYYTKHHYQPNRMSGGFPIFHKGQETIRHVEGVNDIFGRNTEIIRKRYPNLLPGGWFETHDVNTYRFFFRNNVPVNGIVAELGCFKGRSLASVADIIKEKNIRVVVIDTFDGTKSEPITMEMFSRENIKETFLKNMTVFGLDVNIDQVLQMTTHEASSRFEDNYFDMVFIDADHSLESVSQDLKDWWPKVKRGGLISGHDLQWAQVAKALGDKFGHLVQTNGYNIWFYHKPRVFDGFSFYNELDILEIRLNELYDVVDKFILVEATETHSGKPKPMYFEINKDRYKRFLDKIEYVKVSYPPIPENQSPSWFREWWQREQISQGHQRLGVKDWDIVIISDSDEIVSKKTIEDYVDNTSKTPCIVEQEFYCYRLNCASTVKWRTGSRILTYEDLKKFGRYTLRYNMEMGIIENGGWHLSFMGDSSHISNKIKSYAHIEFDRPEITDPIKIEQLIREGKDVFGRVDVPDCKYVDLSVANHPEWLKSNYSKFSSLIQRGKVYDCFMFFDEFDILDIRLNELNDVVDYFVLVESTKTHIGKPKPLYYNERSLIYEKFKHKIIQVVVDTNPEGSEYQDNWARGLNQRNHIMDGLINCSNHDVIIISDVDEIPSAIAVKNYDISMGVCSFDQKFFYYSYDCQADRNWYKAKILPYGILSRSSIEDIRNNETYIRIPNGGWHFTYINDVNKIIQKIENSPHQEFNTKEIKENIPERIKNYQDIFNRGIGFKRVPINSTYPKYLLDNLNYFINKKE